MPFVGVWIDDYKASGVVELAGRGEGNVGAGAATIEVHWDRYEGTQDVWDVGNFADLDTAVRRISAAGMTPVMIVGWAPSWAAPANRRHLNAGMDAEFVEFLQELVRRYSGSPYNVHHYFLWPEADHDPNHGTSDRVAYGSDGAAMARLFNTASRALKEADPQAKVIAGPFAHDDFIRSDPLYDPSGVAIASNGPFYFSFLNSFLDTVDRSYIDGLGLNAYPAFGYNWERATTGQHVDVAAKAVHVQRRMEARGLGSVPIVFGEAGFWRAGRSAAWLEEDGDSEVIETCGQRNCWFPSDEAQAQYIPKYLARSKNVNVESAYHWTFDEYEHQGDLRGVIGRDLSKKLGFYALKQAAAFFGSAENGSTVAGELQTTSGLIEKYGFTRNGNSVVVAWARGTLNPTATVSAPAGSTAVDKMGDAVSGTSVGGRVQFSLTSSPVYITVGGAAAPTNTPGPTNTPTPSPTPTPVPTVVPVVLSDLPQGIPDPDASTGGVAVAVPAGPTGAVATINPGAGAPFETSLTFPAPEEGQSPIGVRFQPGTSLPAGASVPDGVTVGKVVSIDVFDVTTGALRRTHPEALVLTIRLTAEEQAICRSNPGRLALLRVDSNNVVSRLPTTLDCAAGTMTARIASTSSFGLAVMNSGTTIPFRSFAGIALKVAPAN